MEETPNLDEFQFLTDTWRGPHSAGYHATGEICYENGWIDAFGFVTPKGLRAIETFEKNEGKVDKPEDFDTGERIDVV